MPLSNTVVCSLLSRSSGHSKYTCNSCSCEYRNRHGFTNVMNHLRRFHAGFESEPKAEAALRANNSLRLHIVDERTSDIYRWVEWVVIERLPFTFCERRLARQNTRMRSISAKTLASYVTKLHQSVRASVTEILPEKYELVLDG
jgi:hypothetical protein